MLTRLCLLQNIFKAKKRGVKIQLQYWSWWLHGGKREYWVWVAAIMSRPPYDPEEEENDSFDEGKRCIYSFFFFSMLFLFIFPLKWNIFYLFHSELPRLCERTGHWSWQRAGADAAGQRTPQPASAFSKGEKVNAKGGVRRISWSLGPAQRTPNIAVRSRLEIQFWWPEAAVQLKSYSFNHSDSHLKLAVLPTRQEIEVYLILRPAGMVQGFIAAIRTLVSQKPLRWD